MTLVTTPGEPLRGLKVNRLKGALLHCSPNPVHIVVIIQGLEKLANFGPLLLAQPGIVFRDETEFAGDDFPAVLRKPFGNSVDSGAACQEPSAGDAFGDIVVFVMRQQFDLVRAGLNGGSLQVSLRIS